MKKLSLEEYCRHFDMSANDAKNFLNYFQSFADIAIEHPTIKHKEEDVFHIIILDITKCCFRFEKYIDESNSTIYSFNREEFKNITLTLHTI